MLFSIKSLYFFIHIRSKEAEADLKRLTPEFLQMELIKRLAKVPKTYYGEKITQMGFQQKEFEKVLKET